MSLRTDIHEAVRQQKYADLETLVARDARAVRYLVGLSYSADEAIRGTAVKGIVFAARQHPKLVQNVVRRLVWAMNDESGTNALTAPEVICALAEEQPELLLPMVPDLVRLAGDEGLHEGLAKALRMIADRFPGQVGERLGKKLNRRISRRARS
ncbi:MAG: hypothetical protein V1754_12080 [Pseudomonadota bacterium]